MPSLPFLDLFNKHKKSATINLNLIPKDPFFQTALGKTLRWALSVGRYIVIFTELVVILSFLARFSLDRQVTNLNDDLHQKQRIIESYGSVEQNIRLAQYKIDQHQQLEQRTNLAEVFPALTQITPFDIAMEELVIKPASVVMTGRALSQQSLNTLISNIQLSPQFFNVTVGKIEIGQTDEPGFEFQISADTKEQAGS